MAYKQNSSSMTCHLSHLSQAFLLKCSVSHCQDFVDQQHMRVDVAREPAGELLVVFASDARTRRIPYQPVDHDVRLASLAGFSQVPGAERIQRDDRRARVWPATSDGLDRIAGVLGEEAASVVVHGGLAAMIPKMSGSAA